jgi:hypothetical protein
MLGLRVRMSYDPRGNIKIYWSRGGHRTTHFLPKTMLGGRFVHAIKP